MTSTRLLHLLHEWLPRQRWYANKGRNPQLSDVGQWELTSAEAGVTMSIHLLAETSGDAPVLYQIPVTSRSEPLPGGDAALIGTDGTTLHYDGPHDPAFVQALLALVLGTGSPVGAPDGLRGQALAAWGGWRLAGSRVLSGEQSNTSILVDAAAGEAMPVICKIFRVLHHGENPDVAVQCALAGVGSERVPTPLGFLTGEWTDPGTGRLGQGHAAFAQEFLPGVEDGWRMALRAATTGEDFAASAGALGAATASVHADLARAFPTHSASVESVAGMVDAMRERFYLARHDVPSLDQFADAVARILSAARAEPWPLLQRIHGDYHLGQVLWAPGRGWMIIDFEGEPLRPMDDRGHPDAPLRDVAGMLRSLSYAAGSVTLSREPDSDGADTITAWAQRGRESFLDGYADASGHDPRDQSALLTAFELDKALYEARYEARNRPEWLPIPLQAVRRLCGAS
ncbi:trehalose biosynthesis protein [Parafrigoribacterium mesophilum]|uniref:maltokinase N-terminal cap-like domain-containing protein n=1 Tax=Parafrigoribacterium mesophilum TaxID=433646 RepID=UPI0031FDEEE6